ncbi:MAG TPA: hypothetical protein EYN89_06985 [Flavobacteriales bacterium]|nr:hypothetical protein [Flavobacteriales bacterium]
MWFRSLCLFVQAMPLLIFTNSAFTQEEPKNIGESTLSVLSWNLHLLPSLVFYKHQVKRAEAIANVLQGSMYDIIVFQEAFHKRASKKIWKGISSQYPFQYGPIKGSFPQFGSGIWLVSKLEIKNVQNIGFLECSRGSADCRAKKGALFVEVEKGGQKFQIIGTHVQSREGEEYQKVRNAQFTQIAKELIEPNADETVPLIIAGDLNTAMAKTIDYQNMLDILDAENGDLDGPHQFTADGMSNDLMKDKSSPGRLIDYILINQRKVELKKVIREIIIYKHRWREKNEDISDHFAIKADIYF